MNDSSSISSSSTNNIMNQHEQQQPKNRKPTRRRLYASSSTTSLLRLLCSIYVLSAISVIVVRYNITALDTIDFAHQTIVLDDWGQLPHLPPSLQRKTLATTTKGRKRGRYLQQGGPPANSTPPTIVFVHVGKTGGTTVGNMLRILCEARTKEDSRQFCFQQWRERHHHQKNITTNNTDEFFLPESKLSQYTIGFLHVTGMYPPSSAPPSPSPNNNVLGVEEEATTTHYYLITLRNPIERVVSWFYYLHPQNCYQDSITGKPIPRSNFTLIDKACITKRRILQQQHQQQQGRKSIRGAAAEAGGQVEKRFYQDCFPTIHDFAMALQAQPQPQQSITATSSSNHHHHAHAAATECQQLAIQTLEGYGGPNGFAGHLWANYTYYKHKITTTTVHTTTGGKKKSKNKKSKAPKILAVRTEHLWDDLIGIDQMLPLSGTKTTTPTTGGGGGEVFQLQKQIEMQQQKQQQVHNNKNHYHKDKLSTTNGEYMNLCCALQEELKVYEDFIADAINLNHNNKIDTITKVYEQCGGSGTTATTKIQSLEDLKRTCSSLRASTL